MNFLTTSAAIAASAAVIVLGLFLFFSVSGCTPTTYDHGIPNFYQVDSGVWRSGQILTPEAWAYVKTATGAKRVHVIKLNFPENEGSDSGAVAAGYDVHILSIQPEGDQSLPADIAGTFKMPDMRLLKEAMALLAGATPEDVWLVHCTHGMDRTGLVVGMHRVLHSRWTKDVAYAEMLKYHFHPMLHGVHETWENWDGSLP